MAKAVHFGCASPMHENEDDSMAPEKSPSAAMSPQPPPARRAFSDVIDLKLHSHEMPPRCSRTISDSAIHSSQKAGRASLLVKIQSALESHAGEFVPAPPSRVNRTKSVHERIEDLSFQKASEEIREAIPLVPLAVKFGITAIWLVLRLVIYSLLICPAALRFVYAYFFDSRMIRRVRYGPHRRNYVDIYLPDCARDAMENNSDPLPVVIGIMGGAWVMGHRSWNTQLGMRLLDAKVILVAVDYRNYPIGHIPDMVEDVGRAMNWVHSNIHVYGGDPQNIMVHAQSAGAHLTALLLLERSLMEARVQSTPRGVSSIADLKAVVLLSGPYDLEALQPHVIARGVNSEILKNLCEDGDLAGCSPFQLLESEDWAELGPKAAPYLPPMYLFHGTQDQAVPCWSSKLFAKRLKDAGVKNVTLDIREGYTHTLPILEGPMRGEPDMQVELILPFLLGEKMAKEVLKALPKRQRMMPEFLIRAAMYVTPY